MHSSVKSERNALLELEHLFSVISMRLDSLLSFGKTTKIQVHIGYVLHHGNVHVLLSSSLPQKDQYKLIELQFKITDKMGSHLTYLLLLEITSILIISYHLAKATYRLYLYPLRTFPGPTLASFTSWHKIYYNWSLGGLHTHAIKEWHSKYGPIVRIAPNELHFSSPFAYKAIFTNPELLKEPAFYNFMTQDSLVGQIDPQTHNRNRRIFGRYFSASAIRNHGEINGLLWQKANQFCTTLTRLCQQNGGQATVDMTDIARCFSYDMIKELVLEPSDTLSTSFPTFKPPFTTANANITKSIRFAQQFPLLVPLVRALPESILKILSPDLLVMRYERFVRPLSPDIPLN